MTPSDFGRGRSGCAKKTQQGQALIYGLFILVGGLASLFFMFNAGQLTREKIKLVNTADAVAYSAGVMHARTLNFHAYTNRAMVANTVAIAQLVSLSSWVQYASNLGTYGGVSATNPKFVAFYPSYYAATLAGSNLQQQLNENSRPLESLATASDGIVQTLESVQSAAHTALLGIRHEVMNQVASANYLNDGAVTVDSLLLRPTPTGEYHDFVNGYDGADRTRFAEVAQAAAKKDSFVRSRTWFMPALYPDCVSAAAFGRTDWYDRRGGTELIGFDQWQAMDTLSEKRWVPRNKFDITCSALTETPTGWGQTVAADNPAIDTDLRHYDYSVPINPGSSVLAIVSSDSWDYSGLPGFHDLSDSARNDPNEDPRLRYSFRLRRDRGQTATSEGRSDIRNTPRLNAYRAQTAGGTEFVAVSSSEAYFQRPTDTAGNLNNKDNFYGRDDFTPARPREIASLFNPFWQTRLIQSDNREAFARFLQGIVLPPPP